MKDNDIAQPNRAAAAQQYVCGKVRNLGPHLWCMFVCVYVCPCVCVSEFVCVFVRMCVCECMSVFVDVHLSIAKPSTSL